MERINEEIKMAQDAIRKNRIHPMDVESVYNLISDDKTLNSAQKAQKILEYEIK